MISAGVMMAKVIWKAKNTVSGIWPVTWPRTPCRPNLAKSPISGAAPEKARLYPPASHSTEARHPTATQCIITDSTFLARTRPP